MKVTEFLDESDRYDARQSDDDILFEMSNFNYRTTGLPESVEVWTRTDPSNHGHDRYRIKVLKDKEWAAIFSVGSAPTLHKNINNSLHINEQNQILEWIKEFYPLVISLIDRKLDSGEFAVEMQKIRGQK